jgi:DegV family protein with EDD domain
MAKKPVITIVTDSSAYIPDDALVGLNVEVIPLWLIWEGKSMLDGIDIDPATFYKRLRTAKTLPTSSQPTVQEFVNFYNKIFQKSDTIINILVSSKISGTITNAKAAIKQFQDSKIYLVDSLASSMGHGHIVLAAARLAAVGKPVEKIIQAAEEIREKMNFIFVVETLKFLHKGGRIGGAKRYLGSALSIKPLLEFRNGLIEALEQVRTKRKAIARMLDIAEERLSGKQMAEASVVDIDSQEEGDMVAQMVMERFSPTKLFRSGVSPVVGTHVGPGAIGFAFYAEGN